MKTLGIVLARLCGLIVLLGGAWIAVDAIKTARKAKKHKSKTAPFGDDHYETVKQTFPEHASDADTPQMTRERRKVATDKHS